MREIHDWRPPRYDLIRRHTTDRVNRVLDQETRSVLAQIGDEPHAIRQRLGALDREWHLDRALMGLFSVLGTVTAHRSMSALRHGRRWSPWRALFWAQLGFLMHHAVRGWCPPVTLLRRIGFRSAQEISAERVVLEKRLASSDGL
ncbi:MAG: hypothetical protein M3680_18800 [Myxococcota bacterium]|nr:hypothetical protein [Myxococcota bacterium]